ncbi:MULTISPECIES: YybH family protein [unclassified Sphingomonas]|uniref:YybH family protein n=1 Tax=unclassified Sphingomonas TaxID=196159 RepID=UPI0006FDB76E|nr:MULTISPECIES: SgcJ/EcaC family oxidoreductase [unclassified Sphingomonas]KQM61901.1 ketosteroid isomerase [Sphingomonas sp. Leaf16]KQN13174.1 ketosteroid isomerase [Sphingomonas sp. Leaf29]KQN20059.1 ketosteroid isomerase [Sphingomonas sp. Leaf32]
MRQNFVDESPALEAVVLDYMAAFMRGDVEAALATYTEDGVLMAPVGPAFEGKAALAQVYPGMFGAIDFNLTPKVTEVQQISADWGFVRSATSGTQTTKATGEAEEASYLELFLLRKLPSGEWKIARYNTTQITADA